MNFKVKNRLVLITLWLLLIWVAIHFLMSAAMAADRELRQSIHIEWAFDDTIVGCGNVDGFRLYREDVTVCYFPGKSTRQGDCLFNAVPGTYLFTMTAVQPDGYESPHSDNYSMFVEGDPMEITILRVYFTVEE